MHVTRSRATPPEYLTLPENETILAEVDFRQISLLVLDVDGVMTDGGIFLSESGFEAKAFHVQDGHAIKLWQRSGRRAAILSGRRSEVVIRRAAELGVEDVEQGSEDKGAAYGRLLERQGVADAAVCYVGDDLPDLPPMRRCAFPVAVANAAPAVKRAAQYITRRTGGGGAIAEVVELLLRKQGCWPSMERG